MKLNSKKTKNKEGFILLLSLLIAACGDSNFLTQESIKPKDKTILFYAIADNNLNNLSDTIFSIVGDVRITGLNNNLVLYLDDGDCCNLYRCDENGGLQIIRSYGERNSVDENNMKELFEFVSKNYPARETGLIMWSHGTGWLPSGRNTRSFGDDEGEAIDIHSIANSMKDVKFDYIIFDACFMGCVEVAWELYEKTKYILASPAEVPAMGIVDNSNVIGNLLLDGSILERLRKTCDAYVGINKKFLEGKSVSIVDTDKLASVAMRLKTTGGFDGNSCVEQLQCHYFRNQKLFFDARDVFRTMGCDSLLSECIVYSNYDRRNSQKWCGLSVFVPFDGNMSYYYSYSVLNWNLYVGWMHLFGY